MSRLVLVNMLRGVMMPAKSVSWNMRFSESMALSDNELDVVLPAMF